jgi:hypothetical protein
MEFFGGHSFTNLFESINRFLNSKNQKSTVENIKSDIKYLAMI